VRHSLDDRQRDVDAGCAGTGREANRVVAQDLGAAGVHEQRWQPVEIAVER
jgi:hypothetical protein